MKRPIFEAKVGIFGEYGWKKINFLQYLLLTLDSRVCRVRWVERKPK